MTDVLGRAEPITPLGEPIVQLAGIRKSYHHRAVLDDLDLTVHQGEFVALVGASGCGKSTLLNVIGLLERPDAGSFRLFGAAAPSVGSGGARRILRGKLGYLFQNAALVDKDTVGSNLKLAQAFSHTPRRARATARSQALESVGLHHIKEDRRVYELSGGEQLRLAIARLLLRPSELLLADEPTGSLDSDNRDDVLALLKRMHHEGKTIIVVTHDPAVAAAATRTVRIGAGSASNN